MTKLADPRNDVAFKKIFSEDNIEGIKDFAESIISNAVEFPFSTKLVSIEFLHKDQMPSLLKGKKSLCDLKVKDDKNNIYIIEMQKRNEEDYLQRIQYYASHAITDQLEQGTDHTELNPVITISIMGRKCFNDDIPCISYHPFKETTTGKQLLLTQSHIFIELPKLENSGLTGSTLEWLEMFKEAAHLDSIPQVKNKNVLQAYRKLEQHNWSPEEKEAYIASKIDDDMEKSNLKHAEDKGRDEGREEGEQKKALEIARNLLESGLSVDLVIKTTSLSEKEVKNLEAKISDADQNTPV
jgi:predicted transposase/invertase (TIGR01784 family)